jgi:hypothetical protein
MYTDLESSSENHLPILSFIIPVWFNPLGPGSPGRAILSVDALCKCGKL